MRVGRLATAVVLVSLCASWGRGAEEVLPRVGVRVLPFTGVVIPHQQIAGYRASVPLGLGLEVYYTPRLSLAVDLSTSWHGGGDGGDGNLQLSSFQLLGRWWFPRAGWVPFVQGGVGGYQAEIDEDGGSRQLGGVGLAFGGGIEVPLAANCFAQTELRSNWAYGQASAGPDGWIGNTQVLAWFGYKLP